MVTGMICDTEMLNVGRNLPNISTQRRRTGDGSRCDVSHFGLILHNFDDNVSIRRPNEWSVRLVAGVYEGNFERGHVIRKIFYQIGVAIAAIERRTEPHDV